MWQLLRLARADFLDGHHRCDNSAPFRTSCRRGIAADPWSVARSLTNMQTLGISMLLG